jgi:hypothetical protein
MCRFSNVFWFINVYCVFLLTSKIFSKKDSRISTTGFDGILIKGETADSGTILRGEGVRGRGRAGSNSGTKFRELSGDGIGRNSGNSIRFQNCWEFGVIPPGLSSGNSGI